MTSIVFRSSTANPRNEQEFYCLFFEGRVLVSIGLMTQWDIDNYNSWWTIQQYDTREEAVKVMYNLKSRNLVGEEMDGII